MARAQSRFVCQACGEAFLRWEGQCRGCGAWNTLVETIVRETPRSRRALSRSAEGGAPPAPLGQVSEPEAARLTAGIPEFDRVLGGGLVIGSIVVLGGEPGIGKSTLLLQVAAGVVGATGGAGGHVLVASGEESVAQIRLRAQRLGLLTGAAADAIRVVAETDAGRIAELVRSIRPALAIVDSVQTVRVDELEGPAGSVGQVREVALRLQELAKGEGVPIILVGHVTKDGSLAGPRTLEHLVDVVLSLEGERYGALRSLRASKNRFGSTEEVGVFEMVERGLAEVADPGRAFLVEHEDPAPGSAVAATLEGTRPLLVEVQALVAPTGRYGPPRRTASGIDPNRLALLLAVLGRRAGVALGDHDVYANLAGGLSLDDPGLDLALAIALASSQRDRPVHPTSVAVGELGLLGELRSVPGLERRLREAVRLGFRRAIVPRVGRRDGGSSVEGIEIVRAGTLRDALDTALEGRDAVGDGASRPHRTTPRGPARVG